MKIETQSNQNIEKKEATIQLQQEDNELISATNVPFSDFLAQKLSESSENITNTDKINSLPIDFIFDSLSMSVEDAKFFINMTQDGQFTVESTQNGEFKNLIQLEVSQNVVSKKTVEVTNKLVELIQKAQNTQKPVRISFDNDVSVILKIDKNGKVTAEFIPGSIEVENYLRNNIASLRQKFDEQNLPYNDLFYRQNNGRQNKDRNNKEKGDK